MRKTCLIAAFLAVSAAGAHAQTGCRGETISELNECIAAAAPPPEAEAEAIEEATPTPIPRATAGGPLQPRNLRAAPPLVGPPIATPRAVTPDVRPDRTGTAAGPFVTTYGALGPAARVDPNAPDTPAIGLRGVDDSFGVPGTLGPRPTVPTPPPPGAP